MGKRVRFLFLFSFCVLGLFLIAGCQTTQETTATTTTTTTTSTTSTTCGAASLSITNISPYAIE